MVVANRRILLYVDFMSALQVVIAAADAEQAAKLSEVLGAAGYSVAVRADAVAAADDVRARACELAVIDLRSPHVSAADLARAIAPDATIVPEPLDEIEKRHIAAMLRHTRGNKRQAAILLGIARSTLIQKVRLYSLGAVATRPAT